jgi:inverted formin-2
LLPESERGSKLDTLPEEKPHSVQSTPDVATTSGNKRQHSNDWKPSEALKMDVASTMEAIEDNNANLKDKSAWRKSNLNVSNSQENVEMDPKMKYGRQRSRESATLQSIVEEDKRKNMIASLGDRFPTDKLSLYIRKPTTEDTSDSKTTVHNSTPTSIADTDKQSIYMWSHDSSTLSSPNIENQSKYSGPGTDLSIKTSLTPSTQVSRRQRPQPINPTEDTGSNKIEIDSDNIETPPSTRRIYTIEKKPVPPACKKLVAPRPLHKTTSVEASPVLEVSTEVDPLGDGQFDRHSSARRTRRFKRPTDQNTTSTEEKSPNSSDTISPMGENTSNNSSLSIGMMGPPIKTKTTVKKMATTEEERLREWKEKLKNSETESRSNSKIVERVGKIGRSMSRISQEDVREAIRSLKSPTPDRSWSPPRELNTTTKLKITSELNDEGFEETQSLVSDTPSHGKDSNSSCADQQQIANEGIKRAKPKRLVSTDSAATTGSETSKKKPLSNKTTAPNLQTALSNKQLLERSKSVRVNSSAGSVITTTPVSRNLLPKRTNSLRQRPTSLQTSPIHLSSISANNSPNRRNFLSAPNDVERSSSRTSLRSSRSSINSAASCNTVKKMPLKTSSATTSVPVIASNPINHIAATSRKTPLNIQNTSNKSAMPASRSSSSGSSIANSSRKPLLSHSTTTVNTSFKENQQSPTKFRLLASTTTSKSVPTNLSSTVKNTARSSFMRPTTASATKIKGK